MESKNDGQQPVVNNIYGFQFNGCRITNPTFQTLTGSTRVGTDEAETPEAEKMPVQEAEQKEPGILPEPLRTAEAQGVLERLRSAGILDGRWQPVGLSIAQKGVLASLLADRLEIKNLWKTFGGLWRMNSETLRTGCGKSMEQRRISVFRERVRKVM